MKGLVTKMEEVVCPSQFIICIQRIVGVLQSSEFLNNIYISDIEASGKMSGFEEEVSGFRCKCFFRALNLMFRSKAYLSTFEREGRRY